MKISNIWRKKRSIHYFVPWEGTWDEAIRDSAAPGRITYGTEATGQTERACHQNFLKNFSREETFVDGHTQDLLAALSVILAKFPSSRLRVLDFGGAWGAYYYYLSRALPQIMFEWLVIETEATAKALAPLTEDRLRWQSTLPSPPAGNVSAKEKPFDVCLANASLQQIPPDTEILGQLAALGRYLLINRLPMIAGSDDELVLHRVTRDKRISLPARLMSEEKLLRQLKGLGCLRLNWTVPQDVTTFKGENIPYKGYLVEANPF